MGTSFTFLPIAREMVVRSIADARSEGKCDGNDCRGFGKKGYGQFLGTAMAAAWFEVLIAFLPSKLRKKMFPTVVTGGASCGKSPKTACWTRRRSTTRGPSRTARSPTRPERHVPRSAAHTSDES